MDSREVLIAKFKAQIELNARQARNGNFRAFCMYWDSAFFSRRPVLNQIIDVLQMVHDSYVDKKPINVAISCPPRTGKSFLGTLFSAFMLGSFPKESVLRNSVSSTLSERLSKSVLEVIDSDRFRYLFDVELKNKNVESWSLKGSRQGSYLGRGVGGTIIGFGASMLAMTDDLYGGIGDALSDTINESTLAWYEGTHRSRLEKGCCCVDIGTRWRNNDAIGHNESLNRYDYIIRIPALNENGETFCDDVNTTEHYLEERDNIAPEIWEAEYMQNPVDIKGKLFPVDELMWFTKENAPESPDANIGVCDTADEGSDFLSAPMAKKVNDKYYIYDVVFTKAKMEITEALLVGALSINGVEAMRFESNNGGKMFAYSVAKQVSTDITWKPTTSNKETRILMDSSWIKKHCVFRSDYKRGSDYHFFIEQLTSYMKEGKNNHDDAADSMSLFKRFTDAMGLNSISTIPKEQEWKSIPMSPSKIIL